MQAMPATQKNERRRASFLAGASLPLAALLWAPAALADGPRYTWFGAGYEWVDVQGAVKIEGAQHEGYKLDFSLGLFEAGPLGVHVYGDYFDGDFTGLPEGDLDSTTYEAGLGASFGLTESIDLVGKVGYLNSELEGVDDDGYAVEGWLRGMVADNVELEAGYRWEEVKDSDISNQDLMLGVGYDVIDNLSLRVRGILFDDDTGFELGVRWYFGGAMGRDFLFQ